MKLSYLPIGCRSSVYLLEKAEWCSSWMGFRQIDVEILQEEKKYVNVVPSRWECIEIPVLLIAFTNKALE